MKFTIELDCPPGLPRPGHLIDEVIEGTGLPKSEPVFKFFGEWTWVYEMEEEEWMKIQPILKKRIKKLYRQGVIRYGSW